MKSASIFSARSNCPGNRCHLFDTPPNSCETTVVTVADEFCAMPVPEVAGNCVGAHYHDMYIANVR